jgi:hypothetical protein
MFPYVGGVEQTKNPQPTFCVSGKFLASLRLIYLGSFCYTQKMLRVEIWGSSGTSLKE